MVVNRRIWPPSKKDMWPIAMRGIREEFRVCREMLHFVAVKLQQVRESIHRLTDFMILLFCTPRLLLRRSHYERTVPVQK